MAEKNDSFYDKTRGKKKLSIRNVIILILITNLITAGVILYAPIAGRRTVSADEYKFLNQFKKMITVKDIVENNYINKVDENKMVEGAIKGMVDAVGDPYTVFLNQKEYQDLMTQTTGSYAGIGTYVGDKEGRIVVIAPIEDSPAEKAGIKSGDIILKVNDQDVSAKEMDKAVSLMKGKPGTAVKLTLYREGVGTKEISITRATITMKTVKGEMLKDNIGYIRITQFDENTASSFRNTLNGLKAKGMKGLILDLRDNPGGLLVSSTEIADMILGEGKIVSTVDKSGKEEVIKSDQNKLDLPLAVLVNGGSASASEILSGAIKDFKAGTLIGTKTFGKGIVQNIIDLHDGSAVKVTMAKYYTPSGASIQGVGITPDIVIDLPEKVKQNPGDIKPEDDTQLQKAIEIIKSKI
ncbi:S41 family peptidase [Fonticella tunisiensis]|uniref:Carboxyl-terminal processing protease n=1 Tax=Fonticella tunisiensis TaxID=1096341 RepID=A0A4R7KVY3_9CLOT|nr:S41 family peptidase [Fonticella tunisiensis]TDT63711.1 carboxyl-terminal processing protease [Fonticella tunisiensis]